MEYSLYGDNDPKFSSYTGRQCSKSMTANPKHKYFYTHENRSWISVGWVHPRPGRGRRPLTGEIRIRDQLGDQVLGEQVQVLGGVALVRHAPVPDDVIVRGTATLQQGREQARVVEQADLVAAERVGRVVLYSPFGHVGEVVAVRVALERGHVPVDPELVVHVVVVARLVRRRRVFVVVLGTGRPAVRAVPEQPAGRIALRGVADFDRSRPAERKPKCSRVRVQREN